VSDPAQRQKLLSGYLTPLVSLRRLKSWSSCYTKAGYACWVYLVWRRLRGHLIIVYKHLMRDSKEEGLRLFSLVVNGMKEAV